MILITRPIPQAKSTKAKLKQLGFKAICYPFLKINFLEITETCRLYDYDALIITSQNTAFALKKLTSIRQHKIFAVGNKTKEALQKIGFTNIFSANGSSLELTGLVTSSMPHGSKLLYLHGDCIAGYIMEKLLPIYHIDQWVIYNSMCINKMNHRLVNLIKEKIGTILFYSPKTANMFATQMPMQDFPNIKAVCISNNTAKELNDLNFKEVKVAEHPSENSMLELIK